MYEIENAAAPRLSGPSTVSTEIWIAYLHLAKAKSSEKNQELIYELEAMMRNAIEILKKVEMTKLRAKKRNRCVA